VLALTINSAWEREGHRRTEDEEDNRRWQAQQYWQSEVRRVLQGQQQGRQQGRQGRSQKRQQGGGAGEAQGKETQSEDWRSMDDWSLLGLARTPPPSTVEISAAYRREAMRWHPDHNQNESEEVRHDCEERFKKLNNAYGRLRREQRG
jgi:hypothetical protein